MSASIRRVTSLIQAGRSFFAIHKFVSLALSSTALLALFIVPLIGQGPSREKPGREKDSAQQIKRREAWFFHQRAYPLKHIPADVRVRAVEHLDRMRANNGTFMEHFLAQARQGSLLNGSNANPQQITINMSSWTPVGPQPTSSAIFGETSGRVNALVVDPCDSSGNTIYAGGAQGGVWKTTNGGTNWTELTDAQLSISTGAIALDPASADCIGGHTGAIYYGTGEENFAFDSFYGAGVLISHDGGNSWTKDNTFVTVTSGTPTTITPTNEGEAGPFVGNLAVDPATSGATQVLLAGIEGVSSPANSGIWRSTDGGADWTRVIPTSNATNFPGPNDYGTGVAFDPTDTTGNTVYAALGIPFCASIECDTPGDEELDNGVYKSSDSGVTWTRLGALDTAANAVGLSNSEYGRITIATGPAASSGKPGELIVSIADITTGSSNLLAAFKSTDGGNTFTELPTPAFCNAQCFYDMAAIISPANPQLMFLGGGPAAEGSGLSQSCGSNFPAGHGISAAVRSTDGGNTWTDISCDNSSGTFIHVDTHAFAFSPNGNFYIGNDGGVWASSNVASGAPGAQTWTNLNTTLNLTQFYPGNSIHPSNPEAGFAGAQDNGTQIFSGGLNWGDTEACGDGGWTAIDPSTPSTVYAACEDVGQFGIINKNQFDGVPGTNGLNWVVLDTPAMDSDNANFVPPLVLDPTTPQNVYFGTFRVWQSTNGGVSWNIVAPTATVGPSTQCAASGCVITTLSVAPSSSNTIYVGTDQGFMWVSNNSTSATPTFTEIDQANTPGRELTQVVASPANPSVAFAAFSGFSGFADMNGHLFETTNGGTSWTDISCHTADCGTPGATDLPNTPVNDIVVDPNDVTNNTVYVATDVGVFVTTSGGTSWSELASGLPHVECTSLKLNNNARVLMVGTHGRGDWQLQLPFAAGVTSALTAISPTSTAAGSSGVTLVLTGFGFPATPTVNFGSSQLTPSAASATQITVSVPASALTSSAEVLVSVAGGVANSLNFGVEGPVPTLSSASPESITAGSSNVTLTVNGTNFTANSEVIWTPTTGTDAALSTALAQMAGGTSTSFSVTVPASLLTATVGNVTPISIPKSRPGSPTLRCVFLLFVAFLGVLASFIMPRWRRAAIGATVGVVLLSGLVAGCGNNSNPTPIHIGGNSVTVLVNVNNPGPGGGLSAPFQVIVN